MSTRFFTNKESNTLFKKFGGIFEHNPGLLQCDALFGYDGQSSEDLNAGLSAADLEPVIILSESFSSPA